MPLDHRGDLVHLLPEQLKPPPVEVGSGVFLALLDGGLAVRHELFAQSGNFRSGAVVVKLALGALGDGLSVDRLVSPLGEPVLILAAHERRASIRKLFVEFYELGMEPQVLRVKLHQLSAEGLIVRTEGLTVCGLGSNLPVEGLVIVGEGPVFLAEGPVILAEGLVIVGEGLVFLAEGLVFLAEGLVFLAEGRNRLSEGRDESVVGLVFFAEGRDGAAEGGALSSEGLSLLSRVGPHRPPQPFELSNGRCKLIILAIPGARHADTRATRDRVREEKT